VRIGGIWSRPKRQIFAAAVVVAVALGGSLLAVSAVSAATDTAATWTGLATVGSSNWTSASNWSTAGVNTVPASGDTVDTLNFPLLPGCTGTCYTSADDFGALTVNQLDLDSAAPYQISGTNPITLNDGITATTAATSTAGGPTIGVPITLGGPQTWSVSGNVSPPTTFVGGDLSLNGNVTGVTADTVGVTLGQEAELGLAGTNEVGDVTVTGATGSVGPASNGQVEMANGNLAADDLNGTNENTVSMTNVQFNASNTTTGPLTMTNGILALGSGEGSAQLLTVHNTATLNGGDLLFYITSPGATAGTDYPQLSAPTVDLNGVALELGVTGGTCPALVPGSGVETLVSAIGLTGTFAGVPNGGLVQVACGSTPNPAAPWMMINYTGSTVTATPVSSYAWTGLAASPHWDASAPTNWRVVGQFESALVFAGASPSARYVGGTAMSSASLEGFAILTAAYCRTLPESNPFRQFVCACGGLPSHDDPSGAPGSCAEPASLRPRLDDPARRMLCAPRPSRPAGTSLQGFARP
jgi:hypothetical protein